MPSSKHLEKPPAHTSSTTKLTIRHYLSPPKLHLHRSIGDTNATWPADAGSSADESTTKEFGAFSIHEPFLATSKKQNTPSLSSSSPTNGLLSRLIWDRAGVSLALTPFLHQLAMFSLSCYSVCRWSGGHPGIYSVRLGIYKKFACRFILYAVSSEVCSIQTV